MDDRPLKCQANATWCKLIENCEILDKLKSEASKCVALSAPATLYVWVKVAISPGVSISIKFNSSTSKLPCRIKITIPFYSNL